ncbi:alpha-L-rhamnosidase [Pedobacter paludis]|uniref:alpha-L-rhamnosidase n=1 Tax=Pedobacter paludis TaxID=2203212 RepID=A0A317F3D2_9SPHI|nr:alpha-L-rhamnosidase [Pedobacter paludis]PWS33345.1 alpha-L-rhamnosidase [Pedobacter paludis]
MTSFLNSIRKFIRYLLYLAVFICILLICFAKVFAISSRKVNCGVYPRFFANAKWIGQADTNLEVIQFERVFSINANKKIKSATLYLSALGIYESSINNHTVGNTYFAPGWTSYLHRVQFQKYDITALLCQSNNKLKIILSEGWYSGQFGSEMKINNYGSSNAIVCLLKIIFTDGSTQEIVSDKQWKYTSSFIKQTDFYNGEMQDTRTVAAKKYTPVKILPRRKSLLIPQEIPFVKTHETFPCKKSWLDSAGSRILDFGQNLAGFVRLTVKGQAGDTLKISHAEMLDQHGNLYTENLRLAKATDTYILNGKMQTLEPHFTYHGFRYAKITTNGKTEINLKTIRSVALYTDLKWNGNFSCDNTELNKLQQNILWSMKSNFVDIPTDCPQRSERYGWTGDAQVFTNTAAWNADVYQFYKKYLRDLSADQGTNGAVPNIIPDFRKPHKSIKTGVSGWGDAAVLIPWRLYQVYGKTEILQKQYQSMKTWVDYIGSRTKNGIWMDDGYGDWYAQGDSTSLPLINQCYYVNSANLLSRTARILGKKTDAEHYRQLADNARHKFLSTFGTFDKPATSTQTAYLLALEFDLLPIKQRKSVADKLVQNIKHNGTRLATGFLGTPFLLPVLSRFGHQKIAYDLLLSKRMPSWLYPVSKGATTIWEKWDAIKEDGSLQECSFNHFAYGAVGEWFYSGIAGISLPEPGSNLIRITPIVDRRLGSVNAAYKSRFGTIQVKWRIVHNQLSLYINLPTGTKGEVTVPYVSGGTPKTYQVKSGLNHFITR